VVLVVQAAWQAADYQRYNADAYGQMVSVQIDNTDCEQALAGFGQWQLGPGHLSQQNCNRATEVQHTANL
jgi:hypothetical protein